MSVDDVVVLETDDPFELEMAKGLLREAGIPFVVGDEGPQSVHVSYEHAMQAMRVLENVQGGDGGDEQFDEGGEGGEEE